MRSIAFGNSVSLDSRSNGSVVREILQYLSRQNLADFPQLHLELRQATGDGRETTFAHIGKWDSVSGAAG
ncbi:MAG TPA: hypothetical protein VL361_15570 [Candidatus Limnocylindrales bacterium]|nr:hypothetical protein [Candidatus Limnocylindrales bacterium]